MKKFISFFVSTFLLTTTAYAFSYTQDEKMMLLTASSAAGALAYCSKSFPDKKIVYHANGKAIYDILVLNFANTREPEAIELGGVALMAMKNGMAGGKYIKIIGTEFITTEMNSVEACDGLLEESNQILSDIAKINPND